MIDLGPLYDQSAELQGHQDAIVRESGKRLHSLLCLLDNDLIEREAQQSIEIHLLEAYRRVVLDLLERMPRGKK